MLKVILLSLTFAYALATLGYDITAYTGAKLNQTSAQCLVKNGAQFFMIESFNDDGIVNTNFANSYKDLYQAGAKIVDTIATICVYYSADDMCSKVKNNLPEGFNGTVWLSIDSFDDDCFSGTYGKFLQTLENYAKTCQSYGLKVGINGQASNYNWYVSGDMRRSSPFLVTLPLWYEKYDKQESFDDFSDLDGGFGGWERPTIKKYQGYKTSCGVSVGYNFRAPINENLVFE